MRYARRVDANLSEVAGAFRAMGCVVHITNADWDMTIQYGGITMLIEVKDGKKVASKRKLTKLQERLHASMCVRVVKDLSEVEGCVKTLRQWAQFIQRGFTGGFHEAA